MYVCLPMVNIDVFGHRSTFYSNIFVHKTKSSTYQFCCLDHFLLLSNHTYSLSFYFFFELNWFNSLCEFRLWNSFSFNFIKHVWEIIPPGNNKTAELPKVRKLGILVSFWVTSQLSISCLPIKESEKEASFNWIYSRCNKKNLPGKVVPKLMFFSGVSFFID